MKRGYKPRRNLGQDIQGEESISAKALGPWTYFENRVNRIAFFFFWPSLTGCRILVPGIRPGIEPGSAKS